jgi:hypothetical protein
MCICGNVDKIIKKRNELIKEYGPFAKWPEGVKEEFYEYREIMGKGCIAGN